MPLTPEANLRGLAQGRRNTLEPDVLDKLLGLDIVHSMNTGNTITIIESMLVRIGHGANH